jgi:hypothetical protein
MAIERLGEGPFKVVEVMEPGYASYGPGLGDILDGIEDLTVCACCGYKGLSWRVVVHQPNAGNYYILGRSCAKKAQKAAGKTNEILAGLKELDRKAAIRAKKAQERRSEYLRVPIVAAAEREILAVWDWDGELQRRYVDMGRTLPERTLAEVEAENIPENVGEYTEDKLYLIPGGYDDWTGAEDEYTREMALTYCRALVALRTMQLGEIREFEGLWVLFAKYHYNGEWRYKCFVSASKRAAEKIKKEKGQ